MTVNVTSDEWVAFHARRQPGKIALHSDRITLSYRQLNECVGRAAAMLARGGHAPGERIGLLASSSVDWVVAYLAITRAGCVPVGLNYRETVSCIAQQIGTAGVTLALADAAHADLLDAARVPWLPLEGFARRGLEGPSEVVAARPAEAADTGVILFTGGTTGSSKGVDLTHANLHWNCINEILAGDLTAADNVLLATALHHSAALNTWLLPALYLGGAATIMGDFDPRRWLDCMQRYRATTTFTPPTMIRQILDESKGTDDWRSFNKWFAGAGILSAQDRAEMVQRCPGLSVYYHYGLTEAGPIVTCLRPANAGHSPDSIGSPVHHCEVKLLADDGSIAGEGEVGEIVVRGPAVMRGYWGQPRETDKVLRDGWLHTGDLATQDAHGCLIFHDRLKDMIKTGGLNVFSHEVEMALATHPDIAEVAVVGVPDAQWGEQVTAVVSLRAGAQASAGNIVAFAKTRLASYQIPKAFHFKTVEQLPKNYLGKTLKRELRRMLIEEMGQ